MEKVIHRNRARHTCLRCRSKKLKCDHENPCSRCAAANAKCEYQTSTRRQKTDSGPYDKEDVPVETSESDSPPADISSSTNILLEEIEAMRKNLNDMEQLLIQGKILSSQSHPDPTEFNELLQSLKANNPSRLSQLFPINWTVTFSNCGFVVIETGILNASDLTLGIARLCRLQNDPSENLLRSQDVPGGIYAIQEMLTEDDVSEEVGDCSSICAAEIQSIKKNPIHQHWGSIYSRAVSKLMPIEGFLKLDPDCRILKEHFEVPSVFSDFLLMCYNMCFFNGKPVLSGPVNSSRLLQDSRCAWSAQHLAIHHSNPERNSNVSVVIQDPVALSECYYMCARQRLEELFDVVDIQTVEALMVLSSIQAHWDVKEAAKFSRLAIYMAVECGLHQEDSEEKMNIQNGLSFFGEKTGRDIWWFLYYCDSIRAIAGESSLIIDQNARIDIPQHSVSLHLDDFTKCIFYFMSELITLIQITRDFHISLALPKDNQSRSKDLGECVVNLRQWYDSVPELLRMESTAVIPPEDMPFVMQMRLLLDIHYYFFCLVVYAPFFLNSKEGDNVDANKPDAPAEINFYATQICLRAAEVISGHVNALLFLEVNPEYPIHLFAMDTIIPRSLIAAVQVAEYQLRSSSAFEGWAIARQCLMGCLDAMNACPRLFVPFDKKLLAKVQLLLKMKKDKE